MELDSAVGHSGDRLDVACCARPLTDDERARLVREAVGLGRFRDPRRARNATSVFTAWLEGVEVPFRDLAGVVISGRYAWDHLVTWSTHQDIVSDWSVTDDEFIHNVRDHDAATRLAGRVRDGTPRVLWDHVTRLLAVPNSHDDLPTFSLDSGDMWVPFGNDRWMRVLLDIVGPDTDPDAAARHLELIADPDLEELRDIWDRHGDEPALLAIDAWAAASRDLIALTKPERRNRRGR